LRQGAKEIDDIIIWAERKIGLPPVENLDSLEKCKKFLEYSGQKAFLGFFKVKKL